MKSLIFLIVCIAIATVTATSQTDNKQINFEADLFIGI